MRFIKRLLILPLLLALGTTSWAASARNFAGGAATDILTSASTVTFAQLTSYFLRFNITALDTTSRRLLCWGDGTHFLLEILAHDTFIEVLAYTPGIWSTGNGDWSITAPSTGAEHDLLITYDAGATTNKPVIYLDGSSVTVTTTTSPTGTSTFTNAALMSVGNRQTGTNRAFSGWISTDGVWTGVLLSSTDATDLHAGKPPCAVQPAFLSFYAPMDAGESPERERVTANDLTVTGATVVSGSTATYATRCPVQMMTGVGQ